ncbi:Uncharacterized protein TCM_025559 [Theobroma cacao]|uniref:Uncharacterized protein n=1 Tax=Theobroma cacao TaxID=3641 RepID=A0A061EYR5_THECC|nr:Uncharacterized protein TCM_025559 [Theobroma cacao]
MARVSSSGRVGGDEDKINVLNSESRAFIKVEGFRSPISKMPWSMKRIRYALRASLQASITADFSPTHCWDFYNSALKLPERNALIMNTVLGKCNRQLGMGKWRPDELQASEVKYYRRDT